jgi:hypothetical protein
LKRVRVAIDFNDQHARRQAGEIDDVAADDDLPSEFRAAEPFCAERTPELLFERRLVGTEAFGALQ